MSNKRLLQIPIIIIKKKDTLLLKFTNYLYHLIDFFNITQDTNHIYIEIKLGK